MVFWRRVLKTVFFIVHLKFQLLLWSNLSLPSFPTIRDHDFNKLESALRENASTFFLANFILRNDLRILDNRGWGGGVTFSWTKNEISNVETLRENESPFLIFHHFLTYNTLYMEVLWNAYYIKQKISTKLWLFSKHLLPQK